MILSVLNSNSKGNGYILHNKQDALILEAGVDVKKAKAALNYNISKVAALLLTHEHGDHAKHVKKYLAEGIPVITSPGTAGALHLDSHKVHLVSAGKTYTIGGFSIVPFNVIHDVAQPYGYLIKHADMGTLLFITDTHYLNARFPDVNHIVMEANYCEDIIADRIASGKLQSFVASRTRISHMSVQTAVRFLKAQDLSKVRSITLCHLSDGNSDSAKFKTMVQRATGIPVEIAISGSEHEVSI